MKVTSSWLSAISYNTPFYLKYKLDELYNAHKIEFYCFISHLPEEDEKKSHIHLTIKSNGSLDSMEVQEFVKEPDPTNPIPRQTVGFNKFNGNNDDVRNGKLLYDKHDPAYLKSIHQTRKYHYKWDEFLTSNQVELDYYIEICRIPETSLAKFKEAMDKNVTIPNMVLDGVIPLQQINFAKTFKNLLQEEALDRNKRKNHEEFICEICGEVKHVSECNGFLKEKLDSAYPVGTCYKCSFKNSQA